MPKLHICSQSQEDGVKVAALLLQPQKLIAAMEDQAKSVGTNLGEVNSCFYCHRIEINRLKRREEELVKEIIGANHKLQLFKDRLERAEEDCCKCGWTLSVVEEAFFSESVGSELPYAMRTRRMSMTLPLLKIQFPFQFVLLATKGTHLWPSLPWRRWWMISGNPLLRVLREADEGRARELQEGQEEVPHCPVVHSQPRVRSRAHTIGWMFQGSEEGSRELLAPNSISKGALPDTLHLYEVLETLGTSQPLPPPLQVHQSIPLY